MDQKPPPDDPEVAALLQRAKKAREESKRVVAETHKLIEQSRKITDPDLPRNPK